MPRCVAICYSLAGNNTCQRPRTWLPARQVPPGRMWNEMVLQAGRGVQHFGTVKTETFCINYNNSQYWLLSVLTIARKSTGSFLKITNRSFRCASPSYSILQLFPDHSHFLLFNFTSSLSSSLLPSVTHSLFYTRLQAKNSPISQILPTVDWLYTQ